MPSALDELWALQQIDSRIFDLEKQLAALDTGAQAKAALIAAQQKSQQATARLHAVEAEMADVDLSSKSAETKSKDVENRMYSGKVTNPKELEAMQADIQMLKRQRDKLETRELELMDEQVDAKQAAEAAAAELHARDKELRQLVAASSATLKQIQSDLAEQKALRERQAAVAGEANPSYLKKYEMLRTKLGKLVVADLVNNSCGACHINVPADVVKQVVAGQQMVTCESCGRVLHAQEA